jgi:EAL domain-containing protein (putative c-di-GMP-specific phosphodiesterase class I)
MKKPESSSRLDKTSEPAAATEVNDTLVVQVLDGLRSREFSVDFQPIVHVRTRGLQAVECLLRWRRPQYGLLLPAAFSQVFLNPDVAAEVCDFVLDEACRQLSELRREGKTLPRIAVNIQPHQLARGDLANTICKIAARHGVDPSLIELEIVETEACASLLAAWLVQPLRDIGVRLALDDFGTGYSCLSALGSLYVDTVKLAREFLVDVPASGRACDLAGGILKILGQLNIAVVVEGVETASHWGWLEQYPDVHAQGYYVCTPRRTLAQAVAAT